MTADKSDAKEKGPKKRRASKAPSPPRIKKRSTGTKAGLAIGRILEIENNWPPIPTTPPSLWREREDWHQTPIEFITDVYGWWLGRGLTRAHLRPLDKDLYQALVNWLGRKGNRAPKSFDLPTKSEQYSRKIKLLEKVVKDSGDTADTRASAEKLDNVMRQRLFQARHK